MNSQNWIVALVLIAISGCQPSAKNDVIDVVAADLILTGEHIITMDPDSPRVEAVAVAGQEIIATGDLEDVLRHVTDATRVIELGEQALIPGFIDAHGHMPSVARRIEFIELAPPPVGTVQNIDDIVTLVKKRIGDESAEPGSWILGFGYDDSLGARRTMIERLPSVISSVPSIEVRGPDLVAR